MRRLVVTCAIGVLALGNYAWADTAAKKKPKKFPQYSNEQLATTVLAIEDMPPGWSIDTSVLPEDSAPNETTGICNGPNLGARAQASGSISSAYTALVKDPTVGPYFGEDVYAFPTPKEAKAFMALNKSTVAGCPTFQQLDPADGSPLQISVTPVSFTNIGDQTYVVRQTVTDLEFNFVEQVSDVSYVRTRNVVLSAYATGGSTEGQTLLQQAYSKLGRKLSEFAKQK